MEGERAHLRYGPIDAAAVRGLGPAAAAPGAAVARVADDPAALQVAASRERALAEFDLAKKARHAPAPTDDGEVQRQLRAVGEPKCLFGEGPFERRERLRSALARGAAAAAASDVVVVRAPPAEDRLFFTEGPAGLVEARMRIAAYSLPRAWARLQAARARALHEDPLEAEEASLAQMREVTGRLRAVASQVASRRPLHQCRFSPDGAAVAVCGLTADIGVWRSGVGDGGGGPTVTLHGHTEQVHGVCWFPRAAVGWGGGEEKASLVDDDDGEGAGRAAASDRRPATAAPLATGLGDSQSAISAAAPGGTSYSNPYSTEAKNGGGAGEGEGGEMSDGESGAAGGAEAAADKSGPAAFSPGPHVASASADRSVAVWSLNRPARPLRRFAGHEERVNRVAVHPQGNYLLSTSHDETWRLWDVETGAELLLQEGHGAPVYPLALHPDGSLVITGDFGARMRAWDLRTGRSATAQLDGHTRKIVALAVNDARPNIFASASDDNTVKIWDLRKQMCLHTLAAHSKLVSDVAFEPEHGRFLVSASFAGDLKFWAGADFNVLMKAFAAHETRVTAADVSRDARAVVTAAADGILKFWTTTTTTGA